MVTELEHRWHMAQMAKQHSMQVSYFAIPIYGIFVSKYLFINKREPEHESAMF